MPGGGALTTRIYADDPDGSRLPIKVDATSNGGFLPPPLSPANIAANRRALEQAATNAKFTGRPRRDFLVSACGAATVRLVEALGTTQRLLVHGRCMPTYADDLAAMEETAARWPIAAWKTYTQHGPGDTGYFLDDELGQRFIEKIRSIGNKRLAVHKGLPFLQYKDNLKYASSRDVGPAARVNPDITFMIYHSGYDMRAAPAPASTT